MSVLDGTEKLSSMEFSVTLTKPVDVPWQTRYGSGVTTWSHARRRVVRCERRSRIPVYKCGHCTEQELRLAKDAMAREMRERLHDTVRRPRRV